MGGSFLSSAPSTVAAQSNRAARTGNFFIAEILPHLAILGAGLRTSFQNQFSEPGFAAVLAVGIAKCVFEDLGFAACAQGLQDNNGHKKHPKDGPV
jgi:hypothetical protein